MDCGKWFIGHPYTYTLDVFLFSKRNTVIHSRGQFSSNPFRKVVYSLVASTTVFCEGTRTDSYSAMVLICLPKTYSEFSSWLSIFLSFPEFEILWFQGSRQHAHLPCFRAENGSWISRGTPETTLRHLGIWINLSGCDLTRQKKIDILVFLEAGRGRAVGGGREKISDTLERRSVG